MWSSRQECEPQARHRDKSANPKNCHHDDRFSGRRDLLSVTQSKLPPPPNRALPDKANRPRARLAAVTLPVSPAFSRPSSPLGCVPPPLWCERPSWLPPCARRFRAAVPCDAPASITRCATRHDYPRASTPGSRRATASPTSSSVKTIALAVHHEPPWCASPPTSTLSSVAPTSPQRGAPSTSRSR